MMDSPPVPRAAAQSRAALATCLLLTSITIPGLLMPGCRSAPISGRKQLVLIPEAQEIELGQQAYEEALAGEPMSQNAELVAMVERIGGRIAAVAGKPEYDWEFRVIAKDVQNAFALPGGKVAVYEGILPICQSEAGLAVVMSHEIAHAIARHGGERMSQQAAVAGVGGVINAVSQKKTDEATTQQIMQVYGVSSTLGVIYPFSRQHESEADAIGLILMAKAGYDPSVAPEFWERFSSASGSKAPELLSTHPADARRAADLRTLLPEAMKYYEAAEVQLGMGDPIPLSPRELSPRQDVQLAAGVQPGKAPPAIGDGNTKRGAVERALFTTAADEKVSTSKRPSATEDAQGQHFPGAVSDDSTDFKLPIKMGAAEDRAVPPLDVRTIDPHGWESSGK